MPTSRDTKISKSIFTLKYEIGFMASLLTENHSGHDSDNVYNTKHLSLLARTTQYHLSLAMVNHSSVVL